MEVLEQKEQNLVRCKKCNDLKFRILCGKFNNGKDKRWIDENGKLWNGKLCPECNKKRSLVTMRKIRNERKNKKV